MIKRANEIGFDGEAYLRRVRPVLGGSPERLRLGYA